MPKVPLEQSQLNTSTAELTKTGTTGYTRHGSLDSLGQ
jgi:hypothetical protein